MAGILNIASSALTSYRGALNVIANNLANAQTPGYSRQTAMFAANVSQRNGSSFNGTGVSIDYIKRYSDEFINQQVRTTATIKSQYETFYNQAVQVDTLLSQSGTSISTSLQNFFTAMSQLNDSPENMASRGVTLDQSQRLVDQFNSMQKRLDEYQNNTTVQIQESVNIVNQLTTNIANINNQISNANSPPELLDSRDELLKQLSAFVEISTVVASDGTISVAMGGGEMLVIGGVQRNLVVGGTKPNQGGTTIYLENGAGNVDITNKFKTGSIGALKDYEATVLTRASQLLGQMAIGIAQNVNNQHKLGVDLNGQIGKDFFVDFNSPDSQMRRSSNYSGNVGTAIFSVAITDINQTQITDYDVTVSDAVSKEIRITRKSDGAVTVMNWTDSPPTPPAGQIVIDGLTITVDDINHLADNDRFNLNPTLGAARDLKLNLTDPRQLAIASPVRTQINTANTGTGRINIGDVTNTDSVGKSFRIEFISPTEYNLINITDNTSAGPIAFTPNADNTIAIPDNINPSYTIMLSGIPDAGDQFTMGFNSGGVGDNRNGLKLLGLQQAKLFTNGTEGFFDKYSSLISQVGSKTYQAKIGAEAADILYNQSVMQRNGVSEVDQDEEGINLMRFQQAYQAAGRLMSVANDIMDVLFDALR